MREPTGGQDVAAGHPEREPFAALVHDYIGRVHAICWAILGNDADSEDAVQETFLRAYRHRDALRDRDRLAGWIGQIARNLCRDRLRQRHRRRAVAERTAVRRESGTDPAAARRHADLRRALARLPEQHRVPLVLFYFDGQDTNRLARTLDITPAGACTRLSRARRALRALIGEEGGRP